MSALDSQYSLVQHLTRGVPHGAALAQSLGEALLCPWGWMCRKAGGCTWAGALLAARARPRAAPVAPASAAGAARQDRRLRALIHQPRYNNLEIPPLRWNQRLCGVRTGCWGSPESSALCAQEVLVNTVCVRCLIITVGGSASSTGTFSERSDSRSDLLLEFLTEAGPSCLWATKKPTRLTCKHRGDAPSQEMPCHTERGACEINLTPLPRERPCKAGSARKTRNSKGGAYAS